MGLILAVLSAIGVFYLYTALVLHWPGLGFGPRIVRPDQRRRRTRDRMTRAGLDTVNPAELFSLTGGLSVVGALVGFIFFGGPLPALGTGLFAAMVPLITYRHRRTAHIEKARDAWPRLIEEIRILTSSVGRSIPQALFEVGRHAPDELQPAFEAAHREWLLSTDFSRTLVVLKARLADPTADATCETLLIAHELGGSDLDTRLAALADDRRLDVHDRKDARSKQAGARFARLFVLVVPFGMALAGTSIGTGRDAYQTPMGQLAVVVALIMILGCWVWASLIMRLPDEERVLQ